jgi:hypothetical protein
MSNVTLVGPVSRIITAVGADAPAIRIGVGGGGVTAIVFAGKLKITAAAVPGAGDQHGRRPPVFGSPLTGFRTTDLMVLYENARSAFSEPISSLSGCFIQIGTFSLPSERSSFDGVRWFNILIHLIKISSLKQCCDIQS